ncbi:MAG: tRNA (adenosine(37)-N6)-threonylcarbamoyltransferase complex transferase subunit TsaD, partial [Candidatus Tokpelaia sp.]
MRVLGIETSCDETAAAIIERRPDGTGRILANIVRSQLAEHAAFGGVVPEIAARAHVELLDNLIARALAAVNMRLAECDAIAATAGPGLIGGLLVGLTTAKTLALAAERPFLPINHLEGHALTARLTDNIAFPYLLLLVSGGHTQIVLVKGLGQYQRLGTSLDDALGESFDKIARLLGLPYPGGPAVEQAAKKGRAERLVLPRPLKGEPGCDFSFSGLKTAVRRAALLLMEDSGGAPQDNGGARLDRLARGGAPQDNERGAGPPGGEREQETEGARNGQTEG